VQAALSSALFFGAKIEILLAGIAIDPMRHQGMRSVERLLDRLPAMTLLALRHVVLGKIQIIENSVGIRPLLEQIIVLEEMVVTEGRVRRSPASAWSRYFSSINRRCTVSC
jgi:hypothetical protein